MSTLLKMQKFHPLCSRCIGMYPLQNRWTVLRYLQCYENFSECCTHLILPETALFSPTPTFAKEPLFLSKKHSLPPCGGSGLKYHFSRYFQSFKNTPSLPPCGGSGLKCFQPGTILDMQWSPSMRREWIEMSPSRKEVLTRQVSLHAEGVD